MNRLLQISSSFCTKKSNFFWTQVNPKVKEAEYAVRGIVPIMANNIKTDIKNGNKNYPFDSVTFCNIGNPQEFRQKPITFFRQVISCVANPDLIRDQSVNIDARNRARLILQEITSCGSYTHSLGIQFIRQNVAKFIAKSDNVPKPSIDDVILTQGASQGVHVLFNTLITNQDDAIMIPIPQYPLYSAAISLYGGSAAPYYMDQASGWQLNMQEMERSLAQSKKKGKKVKALVIINPGNPTGSILSKQTIEQILQFAVKNRLMVVADEVYRENIYKEGARFISCRSVLETMRPEIRNACELASLHSASKGLLGQCGFRGGYLYIHNFNPDVIAQIVKLKSINLCSNVMGQIMIDCMVNPPIENVSQQTKNTYLAEKSKLFESLKLRAQIVTKYLNSMTNIKSNQVQGAMYAFPSVTFSQKAIAAAEKQGKVVDLFYCIQVLKNTGIALVPGSGFKQVPGTYHFRITTLILPEIFLQNKLKALKKFNDQFHAKYA